MQDPGGSGGTAWCEKAPLRGGREACGETEAGDAGKGGKEQQSSQGAEAHQAGIQVLGANKSEMAGVMAGQHTQAFPPLRPKNLDLAGCRRLK